MPIFSLGPKKQTLNTAQWDMWCQKQIGRTVSLAPKGVSLGRDDLAALGFEAAAQRAPHDPRAWHDGYVRDMERNR